MTKGGKNMIINKPSFQAIHHDGGTMWELIARNSYKERILLKDRGWTFKKEWGKEANVWVIDNLSSAGMRIETDWIWEQGWKINGCTKEELRNWNVETAIKKLKS